MESVALRNREVEQAERLGDQIAELAAHIEVATARLLDLIREFDACGGWGHAGAKSCAEWLSWRVGLGLNAAGEHVRVARALPEVPLIADAFARGELSYSKVRALTRVATLQTEQRLLIASKAMTAAQVERLVRAWRRVDRHAEHRQTAERQKSRVLHVHQDEDGMVVVRGRLTPEAGAVLRRALAAHVDAAVLADPDQPGQSALEDGAHLSAESCRRLACDATRVVMRHAPDGRVTEIGARTRTIPPALRRALNIAIGDVASRGAVRPSRKGITSVIGRKADGATTGQCTRMDVPATGRAGAAERTGATGCASSGR